MMIMTAKVNMKKVLIVLGAIAALLIGIIALFGGEDTASTSATVSDNDSRVSFLKDFGWEVTTSPVESGQVRIPAETTEVFDRYNQLQQAQGYDLTKYGGKKVMRYVYKVTNYPGATDPVFATVLVYKNQIIGGDITDTASGGKIQSFKPNSSVMETVPAPSRSHSTTESKT